ncbi:MAG: hypothetical protein QOF60_2000 [Actinomycetota bacterium]|jgi:hypothetical protein|nr:hypothetical protein [Actinomycetota bacterium]
MTITGADERIHAVEDPSEHWSDSLYFNLWDEESGLFLLTRIAVLPNRPATTAGLIAWLGGKPAYAYGHNLAEAPLADWDDLAVAGLRYRELEPLKTWEITLEDGANRAVLQWEGFTGVVDYADNRQPLPKPVAWGHYEQSARVTGQLEFNGHSINVNGAGQRDHSWGFRDWGGLQEWHWITGFLGTEERRRSFNLFEVVQSDGTRTVNGFVHDGGDDLMIVGAERKTNETGERSPTNVELQLHTDGGRTFTLVGTAHGAEVPVRPAADGGATVVHEQPMRFETDDGLDGYGIYELLENSRR